MRKKLLLFIMHSRIYKWALAHIVPYIRFSLYYCSIRGRKYHAGYKLLKPGHILLTTDYKKLTCMLIPGDFDHAAFCVGREDLGSEYEVAELTHTDFTKSYFFDICKESDRVVILECPDFDSEYIKQMVARCKSLEGAKYDVEFELGVEALYCSELIYHLDSEKRLDLDLVDLAGLGRPYISPQGIYESQNVKIIWDSNNEAR